MNYGFCLAARFLLKDAVSPIVMGKVLCVCTSELVLLMKLLIIIFVVPSLVSATVRSFPLTFPLAVLLTSGPAF